MKEERKKLLTGKYSGHEGEKLVTKSYAYEVDPTVEITHQRSSEKKSLVKKSMSQSTEHHAWKESGYRQRSGHGYMIEGKYQSPGGVIMEEGGSSGSHSKTFSKRYMITQNAGELPSYMRGTALH